MTFTGTAIAVYAEQNTDQGNIGISIDGGAQQTVSTLPSDGQRHTNVAVYTATGLAPGRTTRIACGRSVCPATVRARHSVG